MQWPPISSTCPASATPPGKSAPRTERGNWARSRRVPAPRAGNRGPAISLIPRTKAVIDMPGQYDKRRLKLDLMVACSLFAAGVVVSGMSLAQIRAETRMQTAQATQPLQSTPSDDQNKPAEAKPRSEEHTSELQSHVN